MHDLGPKESSCICRAVMQALQDLKNGRDPELWA